MTDDSTAQSSNAGEVQLQLFGRTDVGQIREHNEDNFLIADLTEKSRGLKEEDRTKVVGECGNLFGVCDGMGGAAAGEVASQMAVDLIYEQLIANPVAESQDELARSLVRSVENAGLKIFNEARANRARRGMGTTSTVAILAGERLFLAQVGDSRAYVLRGERLVQVTKDQSLVNQLIEAGQLTEEEAETFEHNNIILQALGTSETVQVDLTSVELRKGDTLMVCSDGLSGMVRDRDMRTILLDTPDLEDACRQLIDTANSAGGHDNITVLLVRFDGKGLQAATEDDVLEYSRYMLPALEDGLSSAEGRSAHGGTDIQTGPKSEEAENETRELRVSHTMIGSLAPSHRDTPLPSGGRGLDAAILPVTTGLTPPWVGLIVICALLIIAAVGAFLLR